MLLRSPLTRISLLLLFLSHNYTLACPIVCDCQATDNGTIVDCHGKDLTAIPGDVPRDAVEIDLSGNNIMHLHPSNPAIIFSKVRKLNLDSNKVQTLFENFFQKYPNVEEISLEANSIGDIFSGTFSGLTQLKYVYLQDNELLKIKTGAFQDLTLVSLNLERNRIASIEDGAFEGAEINSLRLDYNDLSSFSFPSLQPLQESLKYLTISYNKRALVLDKTAFYGFTFEDLTLSYNGITNSSFLSSVNTRRLDVSGNTIQISAIQQYTNLFSLQELILVNCSIREIGEGYLQHLPSLTILDLSNNKLSSFSGSILVSNSKLQKLLLSDNSLKEVPSHLGQNCPELHTLILGSNTITKLHSKRFTGLSLKELDLCSNSIQVMEESLGSVFDSIPDLRLSGNPLHCNCEIRWFREWLDLRGHNTGADYCYSPKYSYIFDLQPVDFACVPPEIVYITGEKNVTEGEDVFLSCTASGDPAPEIVFMDPKNEGISILPQQNRTKTKTYAMWKVNVIPLDRAGIYTCRAKNVVGETDAAICVSVISDYSNAGLGKCVTTTTSATTPQTTVKTESTEPSTTNKHTTSFAEASSSVPEGSTTTSSPQKPMTSPTIPSTNSGTSISISNQKTTVNLSPTKGSAGGVTSDKQLNTKLVVILCSVLGGVVVIVVLSLFVVHLVKKRRANRRYVVSHKEADILEYHKMNGKPPEDFNCNGHVYL